MEQSTSRGRKATAGARTRLVVASDPAEIFAGLEAYVAQVGIASRAGMVLLALEPYGKGEPFPPGMTRMVFRFLCVTAGLGLIDQLAERDPRCADLLIHYFTSKDKRFEDLSDLVGGISTGRISQLISAAITFLWDALPEHASETIPVDKYMELPRNELLRAPLERSRALLAARFGSTTTQEVMRELVRTRWRRVKTAPLDEQKEPGSETIRLSE